MRDTLWLWYCFIGAGGEMQAYQIRSSSSSLPQTVVMTSPVISSQGKSNDPQMKREIRLAKNRWVYLSERGLVCLARWSRLVIYNILRLFSYGSFLLHCKPNCIFCVIVYLRMQGGSQRVPQKEKGVCEVSGEPCGRPGESEQDSYRGAQDIKGPVLC